MNQKKIFIYGAGGHGKVVADILLAAHVPVAGFVDDSPALKGTKVLGFPVLGDGAWLIERARSESMAVALGIGANQARCKVAERCTAAGIEVLVAVHPTASVAPTVQLGKGTVVMATAAINADARLGLGVIVNTGAVVEHDVVIGDYAHVSPNSALGGGASLGAMSQLGIGATVLPGIHVGSGTTVGAGAVVTRDVGPELVVVGIPAKPLKSHRAGS
ncbi:MAG: acetyltransferase [Acidobacteriia bacterium]|nr:acetyltransferase [Terriglobia bacterium]